MAEDDRPIGVEIVSPGDVSRDLFNAVLAKYSLPLLESAEVAPLVAVT